MSDDQQKRVAERAFDLWEQAGRPDGQDYAQWLQAEREILGTTSESDGVSQEIEIAPTPTTELSAAPRPAKAGRTAGKR